MKQKQESLVLCETICEKLKYNSVKEGSVRVYKNDLTFKEGKDFVIDYDNGYITRTQNSAIPDFSKHMFYSGRFNHEGKTNWGNGDFLIYTDYEFDAAKNETSAFIAKERTKALKTPTLKNWAKENSGKKLNYLLLGDSISDGSDVECGEAYSSRLKQYLKKQYKIELVIHNHTVPGYPILTGYEKYKNVIDLEKYDLASIAFGMNDQNLHGNKCHTPLSVYSSTLTAMLGGFKERGIAAFTITSCYPNKLWFYTSTCMPLYNEATIQTSKKAGVPVADAGYMWQRELASGKLDSGLLINNINHPSAYGHSLYFDIIKTLF